MRKLYAPLLILTGLSMSALAQAPEGKNANPDAPVNLSEPALTPAQPAQYSSTPVENVGQFYVKDGKPVNAAGQELAPAPGPAERSRLMQQKQSAAQQPAERRPAKKANK